MMKNLEGVFTVLLVALFLVVSVGCAATPEAEPEPAAPEAAPEVMPEPSPEPEPMAEPTPAPTPAMEPMVEETADVSIRYTVVRGDNLWDIASYRVIYGNPYQWPLIYKANTHQIDDADLIYPNQVLTIPRDMSAIEVEAAIEHARTRGAWTLGVIEESDLAYLRQ